MNSEKPNIEYLKMIENIIARLSQAGLSIQNWFIVVFCGLITITAKDISGKMSCQTFLIGLLVIVFFFWNQSRYLNTERCYRKKYEQAKNGECENFDLDISTIKKEIGMKSKFCSFSYLIYVLATISLLVLFVWERIDLCKIISS